MADNFEVMSDYLAALELDLRARATSRDTASRSRMRLSWERPTLVVGFVATLLLAVLVLSSPVGRETPAFGAPAILSTPSVDVPEQLSRGLALKIATKSDAPLTKAWPIKAAGGGAYLVRGQGIFCLWARDPDAQGEAPAAICGGVDRFFRIGLGLVLAHRFLASLPAGVPDPTLTHLDGVVETLHPDTQGVVSVDGLVPGDTITLHGTDGQEATTHVR